MIDSNVNGLGTTGYLYYVTGNSSIYRYHLGSGTVALSDETVTTIAPGGLAGLAITSIDILSNGRLVFSDNKANGAVYEYAP